MKKVLVVSGSPRKRGDGYKIAELFRERLEAYGDIEFNYLFLRDFNLDFCRGCMACMKREDESCPIKDDRVKIREMIESADGVIFSSPVYEHHISALLKNFYDRFVVYMHRPRFFRIPAILLITTELSGDSESLHYMRFIARVHGYNLAGSIGVVMDPFKYGGLYAERIMKRIDILAERFRDKLVRSELPVPSLGEVIFFNKLRTKVKLHRGKLPFDFEYFKRNGWLESDYYYNAPVNPVKKFIAAMPLRAVKLLMRFKVGGGYYGSIAPLIR